MKTKQINVLLGWNLYKQLDEVSRKYDMTRSEIVRVATIEWLLKNNL